MTRDAPDQHDAFRDRLRARRARPLRHRRACEPRRRLPRFGSWGSPGPCAQLGQAGRVRACPRRGAAERPHVFARRRRARSRRGASKGPASASSPWTCPRRERLGDGARLHEAAPFTVTVDHHAVPRAMSDLSYTDPDAASTSLLIWELAALLGADRERLVATCCYTGLMTDTGRFQHGNTDAAAFKGACEMVAAGARPGDIAREFYPEPQSRLHRAGGAHRRAI